MFKQGDKVELLQVDAYDKSEGLYIGMQGVCQEICQELLLPDRITKNRNDGNLSIFLFNHF